MEQFQHPIIRIDDSQQISVYLPDYSKYFSECLMDAWVGSRSRVSLWDDEDGVKWFTVRKTQYEKLRAALVTRYGVVYVNATHKELSRCDQRCIEAKLSECSCSCLGMGHGTGDHEWTQVKANAEQVVAQLVFTPEDSYVWLEESWVSVTPMAMMQMYGHELAVV